MWKSPPQSRARYELCGYTMTHRDASFIHQHVVDAYMAQHRLRRLACAYMLMALEKVVKSTPNRA